MTSAINKQKPFFMDFSSSYKYTRDIKNAFVYIYIYICTNVIKREQSRI